MALTLKNYATTLSPDLLAQAKKNKVRECDETPKGHFVAYVDDGTDSFDVSLTVKAGNEIIAHTCECESKAPICRHKVALIIHLAEGKKANEVVKVKKKVSKTDALLDDADPHKLKEWVRILISKNKEIELSFTHYFSVKEQLTPAEVAQIVNDAIKAVGVSKKIDATQLKKLIELWSETLGPIAEQYYGDVTGEKSFLNFHTMLETCHAFWRKTDTTSTKISKFIEDSLQKSVEPIGNLQVEEAWDKAVGFIIAQVPNGQYDVRMHYIAHLNNIVNASSEMRKEKLIDRLVKQMEQRKPHTSQHDASYRKFVFAMVDGNNLFPKYSDVFKPIFWQNDYNERLITLLIANNHLDEAKKYCKEQIEGNSKEDYNIPYLKLLREILIIQKDDEGLAKVLAVLFPYSFNFDDYIFISSRLPEEERKKWRTKMFTRARNSNYARQKECIQFCFKLADHEKIYRKMIDYIESYTPYTMILPYLEKMIQADKDRLIQKILNKRDGSDWGWRKADVEKDAACFPEFFSILEKYYTANYLKMAIKNTEKDRWNVDKNYLIIYMKKQLGSLLSII